MKARERLLMFAFADRENAARRLDAFEDRAVGAHEIGAK